MTDIYLDEDVSDALLFLLEERGHDVLTTLNLRSKGTSDAAQLALAARLGRVLVTHNRAHFRMLHDAWRHWSVEWVDQRRPEHAGILIVPQAVGSGLHSIADEIDGLVGREATLRNRLYDLHPSKGWERFG